VPQLDGQQIELIGLAALTTAMLRQGFEIARPLRDRGVDLIVFSDTFPRPSAIPIQAKIHSETGLDVYREKYQNFPGIVYAIVWHAASQPRYFLFDHTEACSLIPETSRQQSCWTRPSGHWVWTHPVPQHLHVNIAKFENRWDWLRSRLSAS
jgi:hypothetical protein